MLYNSHEKIRFFKKKPTDKVWWVDWDELALAFSFDKKEIIYLFGGYQKLTPEEKEIFDKENPYWADYFSK